VFENSRERPNRYTRGALMTYAILLAELSNYEEPTPAISRYLNLWVQDDDAKVDTRNGTWCVGELLQLEGADSTAFEMYKWAMIVECALHSDGPGADLWNQANISLGAVATVPQLHAWIVDQLLPCIEVCKHDHRELMQRITWPLLLDADPDQAEGLLNDVQEVYARRFGNHEAGLKLLKLSILEANALKSMSLETQSQLWKSVSELDASVRFVQLYLRRAVQTIQTENK